VAVLAVRSTPGSRVCWPGRVFAGGARETRALRAAASGAVRRWASRRAAPLRRGNCAVAQSAAHLGAVLSHMRDQARRGARDLSGHRPPGHPPRGRSAHRTGLAAAGWRGTSRAAPDSHRSRREPGIGSAKATKDTGGKRSRPLYRPEIHADRRLRAGGCNTDWPSHERSDPPVLCALSPRYPRLATRGVPALRVIFGCIVPTDYRRLVLHNYIDVEPVVSGRRVPRSLVA